MMKDVKLFQKSYRPSIKMECFIIIIRIDYHNNVSNVSRYKNKIFKI